MRRRKQTSPPGEWRFLAGPAARALLVAVVFLLVVAGFVAIGVLPRFLLWSYAGLSVVTFALYAKDKAAARHDEPRTPEDTLHTLALLGGWPGALYARQLFRHKSSKRSFSRVFWLTVVLNVAALAWLVSDYGTWLLETLATIGKLVR